MALDERLSNREVARITGVSAGTVAKYRSMMRIHRIGRVELDLMADATLIENLQAKHRGNGKDFIEPDWNEVFTAYQQRDVTIALLYQEYAEASAGRVGTLRSESSFGRELRRYCTSRNLSMRQQHLPGQEMFVDFSGKHLYLTNPSTGERTPVEIFVASLGASRMLFATAVPSQKKPDWIESNVRANEYFGGAAATTVPDNLKSAVTKPGGRGREPWVNRSYLDFADHYGTIIVPARPIHPQDKSLAEISVRIVNMWVIAALRNHIFYSIDQINAQIAPIVDRINAKKTRRLGGLSRREIFESEEAGCLLPLPATRHQYTEWYDGLRVPKDYHVQYNRDYYSVPHHLVGRTVSFCATRSTIRIFSEHASQPAAVHALGPGTGSTITNHEHMPEAHRMYAGNNTADLLAWGDAAGTEVRQIFDALLDNNRVHPISAIRQMSRTQKLAKEYGYERLKAACRHAMTVGTKTVDSVANILRFEIDIRQQTSAATRIAAKPVAHQNVRGAAAYSGDRNDNE